LQPLMLRQTGSQCDSFVSSVGDLVNKRLHSLASSAKVNGAGRRTLRPGKMLRSRLAARLYAAGYHDGYIEDGQLVRVCAATELAHTGSLCHDDVIDSGFMRRFMPSLWRNVGSTGAVLIGDLLLCDAMKLIVETSRPPIIKEFVSKLSEVVEAETAQEFSAGGGETGEKKLISVARSKTGPLFAFPAMACGWKNRKLSEDLEEAGYLIGTAYQLGDDLLDEIGSESALGKTLGTDRAREKPTLPQTGANGNGRTEETIGKLLDETLSRLARHPDHREALLDFITADMSPVFEKNGIRI